MATKGTSGYETQLSRYTPFFTTLIPFVTLLSHIIMIFFLSLLLLNGMTALTQWLVLHTRATYISCQATFHHRKSSIIYLKAQVLVLHWDNCDYMLYASVLCLCTLCLCLVYIPTQYMYAAILSAQAHTCMDAGEAGMWSHNNAAPVCYRSICYRICFHVNGSQKKNLVRIILIC